MRVPRHSITTKLLLLFLLVGLSTVMIIGFYSFYSAKKAIMGRTVDQLISVRAVKKQQVEYFFTEKIRNLLNLSYNPNLIRAFHREQQNREDLLFSELELEHLRNFYQTYGFTNLYLVAYDSNQILNLNDDSITSLQITPALGRQITLITEDIHGGKPVAISDLFFKSEGDSIPVCLIGCKVATAQSVDRGAVILEIPASEINRIMLQDNKRIGLGNSGEAYLVGADFMMRSTSRFNNKSLLRVPVRSETVNLALQGQSGAAITNDYRGILVFSAYESLSIPGLKWAVLAEIDYEEALVPVTGLRNDILLVSLIISFFLMGFSQVITKMVTQPIIKLKNAAVSLGEGNFDNKVLVQSRDEIGSLAETFNTMSVQIREERHQRILALFDGQEMERRRISRELHDGLGQKLVGTKLQLENCNEDDHSCLKKTIHETKSNLRDIIEELRRISNDLMPASLDELGLETALQNLCDDVCRQTGIEVESDVSLISQPMENVSVYLFRIAQEGFSNIIKHAGASSISMQLIENREFLIFMLEDNGTGFDPGLSLKGNGLSNMKERVALVGGTLSVESKLGSGTTIRVKIPNRK